MTSNHPEIDRLCEVLAQDTVAAANGRLGEPETETPAQPLNIAPELIGAQITPLAELALFLEKRADGYARIRDVVLTEFSDPGWASWYASEAARFKAWAVAAREAGE